MPANPKLEYEAKMPAFLKRLKGQYAGPGERQELQFARPQKKIIDGDDDEPTYVNETGTDTISREDAEDILQGNTSGSIGEVRQDEASVEDHQPNPSMETLSDGVKFPRATEEDRAVFGATSRKRAARVVAADEDERTVDNSTSGATADNEERNFSNRPLKSSKLAKKRKKVKLSFDEGDEAD